MERTKQQSGLGCGREGWSGDRKEQDITVSEEGEGYEVRCLYSVVSDVPQRAKG